MAAANMIHSPGTLVACHRFDASGLLFGSLGVQGSEPCHSAAPKPKNGMTCESGAAGAAKRSTTL
jgi:hypothetical protein